MVSMLILSLTGQMVLFWEEISTTVARGWTKLGRLKLPGIAVLIDFGTFCSCVGFISNSGIEIVTTAGGTDSFPSVVAYVKGRWYFGEDATKIASNWPKCVIYDVKMMLGRHFSDREIQARKKRWQFAIQAGKDDTIEVVINGKTFTPLDIAAEIFKGLKKMCEERLGHRVCSTILTVPSHFDPFQREDLFCAARNAGFEHIWPINESVAAAVACQIVYREKLESFKGEEKRLLLVDLGNSSLNISLVKNTSTECIVEKFASDGKIGGQCFTVVITDHYLSELKLNRKSPSLQDIRRVRKVEDTCEIAKATLSEWEGAYVSLDFVQDKLPIYRKTFEEATKSLRKSCLELIHPFNKESPEFDFLVLLGGRMNVVTLQTLVENCLKSESLSISQHYKDLVIRGACVVVQWVTRMQKPLLRRVECKSLHYLVKRVQLRNHISSYHLYTQLLTFWTLNTS